MKQPEWTEGLDTRSWKAIVMEGINSREELVASIKERRLYAGDVTMARLREWAGVDPPGTYAKRMRKKKRVRAAITFLNNLGYRVVNPNDRPPI